MGEVLHTPRLLLRPMAEADATLYVRLYGDAGVMRLVAAPLSPEAAQRAFGLALTQARATPPRARYWICHVRDRREDAGLLALLHDRGHPGLAEVGILLLAEAQGRGHATEAIAALADHAFAGPGLQRLWVRHARDNLAMTGLMRALGFGADTAVRDGESRWSLRREDWPTAARAAAFAKRPAGD